MTSGQYFTDATCPDCDTSLPELTDKGGWGLAQCPNCKKMFDTDDYRSAGGKFHTGSGCKCLTCSSLESQT